MINIKKADAFVNYTKSLVLECIWTPYFLKDTGCKHYRNFYKIVIQTFPGDDDIVLIYYQIDTTNIAYNTYIFLKLTLLASQTFLVRSHEKHMASIKYPQRIHTWRGFINSPVSWSLSSERLGVVCTNPPLWEKEKRNADFKEILSI